MATHAVCLSTIAMAKLATQPRRWKASVLNPFGGIPESFHCAGGAKEDERLDCIQHVVVADAGQLL